MAYDGRVMRQALQRFEEDRQRRQTQYQERRERIYARQPRDVYKRQALSMGSPVRM